MNEELKYKLRRAHLPFFERLKVDATTGIVHGPCVKFATYPHIGKRYGKIKKLLIVGKDIGMNPAKDRIYSFEDRRAQIEDVHPSAHNPHMSGTYMTAIKFLADEFDEWDRWWTNADKEQTAHVLLQHASWLPSRNPLSYIAFTNFYKFLLDVNGNKVQLNREVEEDFLLEEARILSPDLIIFQGEGFRSRKLLLKKLSTIAVVFVGYHPSARREKRKVGNLIRSIEPGEP